MFCFNKVDLSAILLVHKRIIIPKQFTGNPVELCEFIQNVEAAYEVIEPVN